MHAQVEQMQERNGKLALHAEAQSTARAEYDAMRKSVLATAVKLATLLDVMMLALSAMSGDKSVVAEADSSPKLVAGMLRTLKALQCDVATDRIGLRYDPDDSDEEEEEKTVLRTVLGWDGRLAKVDTAANEVIERYRISVGSLTDLTSPEPPIKSEEPMDVASPASDKHNHNMGGFEEE